MVEIYNEQIHDLLADDSLLTKYPFTELFLSLHQISWVNLRYFKAESDIIAPLTVHTLEIRSCMSGNGLPLPDASMHLVNCATDVIALMKLGDLNRAVGCTAMNNRSSRSHRWDWTVLKLSLLNFHSDQLSRVIKIVKCTYVHIKYMQCADCTCAWWRYIWKHNPQLPTFGGSCW